MRTTVRETPMPSGYDPKVVEAGKYDAWQAAGHFKPSMDAEDGKKREPYCIMMPPPNVTGQLHLGHALTSAVQDCLIRWRRMSGYDALYVPGLDHAGIATQVVVEKQLKNETGKSRHDLGREAFLGKVREWVDQYGGKINNQLHRTGVSCDWDRGVFSMDEKRNKATVEAFVRMHEKGKITRNNRLVNWSCSLKSAISDIEVDHQDVTKNQFIRVPGYEKTVPTGFMFKFAYKVDGMDGPNDEVIVATTRPETILGDTGVAVHPEDDRYTYLRGKKLKCPFRDELIPVVFDNVLVNKEFGTGAVKITPAHDPNDYECGKRHNLPFINILTDDGCMNDFCGEFKGMKRYEVRKAIMKRLEEMGLARGNEGHEQRLGFCSRSKDVVEPIMKPQWYVDINDSSKAAVEALTSGRLTIRPEMHHHVWHQYLGNPRPWCVSRQLWWGHRVPAWYATLDGPKGAGEDEDPAKWVVARNEEEALIKALKMYDLKEDDKARVHLAQDPDVLDTWFSAALHPFYSLNWPDCDDADFKKFYPTQLLETGHDILFFWVAKMVMMGLELTGQLPFDQVYLHAMVRDKDGSKMSKSSGNALDPLNIMEGITLGKLHDTLKGGILNDTEIEKACKNQKRMFPKGITECGSDALRFGLLAYTASAKSVNLDVDRVQGYRFFCNKMFQACKFFLMHAGDDFAPAPLTPEAAKAAPLNARWILAKLNRATDDVNAGLEAYDFAKATTAVYSFLYYEYCDVFLELCKQEFAAEKGDARRQLMLNCMWTSMEAGLRLLHPFMPFLTEELRCRLPGPAEVFGADSIMVADYPKDTGFGDNKAEEDMELVTSAAHAVRSIKSGLNIMKEKCAVFLYCRDDAAAAVLQPELSGVAVLSTSGEVKVVRSADEAPKTCLANVVNPTLTVLVDVADRIDIKAEIDRQTKKMAKAEQNKAGFLKKQAAPGYADKVPANVQALNQEKIDALTAEITEMQATIETLKGSMPSE